MTALLETAARACDRYGCAGVRCSTRPDAVDSARLDLLKAHRVTAVELGAQSMDDGVLQLNRRGHTARDVENAAALLSAYGFELGLQMMTGLPGDTDDKAVETARALLRLRPDTMRIYPTVVLENTALCDWYRAGHYAPQTLDAAVSLCARLIPMIEGAGVRLIRVGLHAGEPRAPRRRAVPPGVYGLPQPDLPRGACGFAARARGLRRRRRVDRAACPPQSGRRRATSRRCGRWASRWKSGRRHRSPAEHTG